MKTHTTELNTKRKLEESKIEKIINGVKHKREHTSSYSCVNDIQSKNSRIDFVIEKQDVNGVFGLVFLEIMSINTKGTLCHAKSHE